MGKLIVVQKDKVEGTDTHNVTGIGSASTPSGTGPFNGTGKFDYLGKMTDQLSDFVNINGKSIALKSSKSSLDPGENAPLSGKHSGPMGKSFVPGTGSVAVQPNTDITLKIIDTVGEGSPSASSGSSFVKAVGEAVLLDGDKIDTCDGTGKTKNSSVTAEGQVFVSCSE